MCETPRKQTLVKVSRPECLGEHQIFRRTIGATFLARDDIYAKPSGGVKQGWGGENKLFFSFMRQYFEVRK